jgi:hypothetical protein
MSAGRGAARSRLKSSPQDHRPIFVLEAEARAGRRMGAAQGKVAAMTSLATAQSACAPCWRSPRWPASAQVSYGILENVTPPSGKMDLLKL